MKFPLKLWQWPGYVAMKLVILILTIPCAMVLWVVMMFDAFGTHEAARDVQPLQPFDPSVYRTKFSQIAHWLLYQFVTKVVAFFVLPIIGVVGLFIMAMCDGDKNADDDVIW